MRYHFLFSIPFLALALSGCAVTSKSNTSRTASEQLLLSSAIDRSVSNVSFHELAGKAVFVDEKYLEAVDKGYLVGTVRHKVLASGGKLAADAAAAEVVLEVRSGGLGTDMDQSFIGMPAIGVPGLPIEIPEIKLVSRDTQKGTAKIGIVAYDPKTGEAFGLGGETTALANNENTYVLGIGPFRSGAVKDQMDGAIGAKGQSAFSKAMGVQTSKRRMRPVSLVDHRRSPPTPKISTASNALPLPTVPASHSVVDN